MRNTIRVFSAVLALIAVQFSPFAVAAPPQEKTAPTLDQAGFRRMKLGALTVVALSDGTTVRNAEKLVTKLPATDVAKLMAHDYRYSEVELSINAFLVDDGRQRVLIDTGAGDLFAPEAGLLTRSLQNAGYSADQINVVVLTHIHADHSGGLMRGGTKTFPNATVFIPKNDAELFLDKEERSKAPKAMQHVWDEAERTIGPYIQAGQTRRYTWGSEIAPGISSLPAPGHTPGHSVVVVTSNGQRLYVLGDTVHVAEIQFPRPDAAVVLDVDQDRAVTQRMTVLDAAAEGRYWVAFDHVSFPGIGHVRKRVGIGGFEWVPMPFTLQE